MRQVFLALTAAAGVSAGNQPIRRIVTLLQDMQKEIEAEMATEKQMFEKFSCYCKQSDGKLSEQGQAAQAEVDKQKAIEEQKKGQKKKLGEELVAHKKDRTAAQKALAAAIAEENKRVTEYEEEHKEVLATIAALEGAIKALNKGMGKAFLQTDAASSLRRAIAKSNDVDAMAVLSFLDSKGDYHSASGEIVGILKQMLDQMNEDMNGDLAVHNKAVETFKAMKSSKEQEIAALSQMIEQKTELKGKVAVEIVQAIKAKENALKEAGDAAAFLIKLKEMCTTKDDEYKVRVADAQSELEAIHQAILVLNDDDALDVFQAADPKALVQNKVSFLQTAKPQQRALALVSQLGKMESNTLSVMANTVKSALNMKQGVDFSKIITMIDEMVAILKSDAKTDLETRDQCTVDLNQNEMDTKDAKHKKKELTDKMAELAGLIKSTGEKIAKNEANVVESKKSVAEATEQRQKENAEYHAVVEMNTAAVQLIDKAINILNKYYNPAMYKAPEQRELTEEERIAQNSGVDIGDTSAATQIAGTSQMTSFLQKGKQPSDPTDAAPDTWDGGRKNKGQKSNSVIALMRMLQTDIKKDTTAVEADEQTAQRDYETLTEEAAHQQAEWAKSTADLSASKAQYEEDAETADTDNRVNDQTLDELSATNHQLHANCDFILANFEVRQAARENEMHGLVQAKGVLSGMS